MNVSEVSNFLFTRKNLMSKLVLVVVIVQESKDLFYEQSHNATKVHTPDVSFLCKPFADTKSSDRSK